MGAEQFRPQHLDIAEHHAIQTQAAGLKTGLDEVGFSPDAELRQKHFSDYKRMLKDMAGANESLEPIQKMTISEPASAKERSVISERPASSNVLYKEKLKDGATVTEFRDGSAVVSGIEIGGKSYTARYPAGKPPSNFLNYAPKVTDANGKPVDPSSDLYSKISDSAFADGATAEELHTLDELHLDAHERQEIDSMVKALEHRNWYEVQQLAARFASEYSAQQFEPIFRGLRASAALAGLREEIYFSICDEGTIDGTMKPGQGELFIYKPDHSSDLITAPQPAPIVSELFRSSSEMR